MCVCVCVHRFSVVVRVDWRGVFFLFCGHSTIRCAGWKKKQQKSNKKLPANTQLFFFFFPRQASTSNAHAHARLHFGTTPRNKFRNKIVANGTLVRLKQTNKQTNKQNRSFRLTNPDRKKKKLSSSIGRALWKIKSCRPIRCSRPSATPRPPVTTTRPVS